MVTAGVSALGRRGDISGEPAPAVNIGPRQIRANPGALIADRRRASRPRSICSVPWRKGSAPAAPRLTIRRARLASATPRALPRSALSCHERAHNRRPRLLRATSDKFQLSVISCLRRLCASIASSWDGGDRFRQRRRLGFDYKDPPPQAGQGVRHTESEPAARACLGRRRSQLWRGRSGACGV